MLIQTLGKEYTIIKYIYSDDRMERYLCREEGTGEKKTVVRIKDREWITENMEFFMQQMDNTHFTDFEACFVSDGYLHIIMRHTDGVTLREKLDNEKCTVDERLAVGRALLDKMMVQDMPGYFLQDCLKVTNIIVTAGQDVGFEYEMSGGIRKGKVPFPEVQNSLSKVFKQMFSHELHHKTAAPLCRFYQNLRQGKYEEFLDIYTAYDNMCKEIRKTPPESLMVPQTLPFRIWGKMSKGIVYVKRMLAVLLFIAALCFLAYAVRKSGEDGSAKRVFEHIGTLQIRDNGLK